MTKVFTGRYFEDFVIGQRLVHAVPRTLHGGDIALYMALTGERPPLASSTDVARGLGFVREVVPDLLVFHIVFGKSVADISHNAAANLGYADVRFLRPVYPGDTLVAESEVIGLREVSSGEAGVVYVRTRGTNQKGQEVLSFVRWVLIPKRDKAAARGVNKVPQVPSAVTADRLPVPDAMNLQRFATRLASAHRVVDDHEPGSDSNPDDDDGKPTTGDPATTPRRSTSMRAPWPSRGSAAASSTAVT
jgi:2-methylfumaryl-CoA hydratase